MPAQSELSSLMVRIDPRLFDELKMASAKTHLSQRIIVERCLRAYLQFLVDQVVKERDANG